ncbi:Dynactin subunit 5 [Thelohanellus kitauei]|uniref:Dynactin subunit 5 n=1 Tax=Thelohanellus kitauei TaxID=669202 RepID=A0A0C2JYB9_THEKT|nr:Dynactin subunit 5 [Thelohanellus kitauei]
MYKAEKFSSENMPYISDLKSLVNLSNIVIGPNCVFLRNVQIRGDMAAVNIGHHTMISQDCVLKPPDQNLIVRSQYVSMNIGNYVFIDSDCIIRSIDIGSHVFIGKNCILESMCKVSDMCYICDDTVIPYRMVIPPMSVVRGNPASVVSELPECFREKIILYNQAAYQYKQRSLGQSK